MRLYRTIRRAEFRSARSSLNSSRTARPSSHHEDTHHHGSRRNKTPLSSPRSRQCSIFPRAATPRGGRCACAPVRIGSSCWGTDDSLRRGSRRIRNRSDCGLVDCREGSGGYCASRAPDYCCSHAGSREVGECCTYFVVIICGSGVSEHWRPLNR